MRPGTVIDAPTLVPSPCRGTHDRPRRFFRYRLNGCCARLMKRNPRVVPRTRADLRAGRASLRRRDCRHPAGLAARRCMRRLVTVRRRVRSAQRRAPRRSSRIENHLGFPTGIPGSASRRARIPGAQVRRASRDSRQGHEVRRDDGMFALTLVDASASRARSWWRAAPSQADGARLRAFPRGRAPTTGHRRSKRSSSRGRTSC